MNESPSNRRAHRRRKTAVIEERPLDLNLDEQRSRRETLHCQSYLELTIDHQSFDRRRMDIFSRVQTYLNRIWRICSQTDTSINANDEAVRRESRSRLDRSRTTSEYRTSVFFFFSNIDQILPMTFSSFTTGKKIFVDNSAFVNSKRRERDRHRLRPPSICDESVQ